jgi:hypothetical protein
VLGSIIERADPKGQIKMMPGRDELNNVRRAMPLTQSRRWFNRFRILHME